MQSDVYYDYCSYGQGNRALRGPRLPQQQQQQHDQQNQKGYPSTYTPRQPRKPIEVRIPPSKKIFQQQSQQKDIYVYPAPKPLLERKSSKTELEFDDTSSPAPSSSTKTYETSSRAITPSTSIHKKKVLPRPNVEPEPPVNKKPLSQTPVNRTRQYKVPVDKKPTYQLPVEKKSIYQASTDKKPIYKAPVDYYSSADEEEDDQFDDEVILRDLNLSRRKSVHDITISDDEDNQSDDDYGQDIKIEPTITTARTKNDLPPIPQISAPDYSSSSDEEQSISKCQSDLPPIPTISAPDYSNNEDDGNRNKSAMPPIPTICVPGGFSDDEEDEEAKPKTTNKKNSALYNSLYFGIRCGGCDEPLSGQAITTSGKHWHTHCFKCQACRQNLEHIAFYEKDSLPYCALDYHELFSPRCDYCKTPIEEHSITALGKTYHAGHFFCRECGKPFDEETNFLEHEGHAYCEKDYYKQFGKACKGCEETITGDFLVALGGEWHKECFVCADCGGTFTSSTFLIRGGKPYCEDHYHKQDVNTKSKKQPSLPKSKVLAGLPSLDSFTQIKPLPSPKDEDDIELNTCHRCQKSIQGRCSSAFGYDYHPLHFQCSQCHKLLSARLTGKCTSSVYFIHVIKSFFSLGLYQETNNGELVCKSCVRKSNK
jgi:hypothetical protein